VTLKYAQLDRYATTAQIFTEGQSVNRLVVRDFINPSSNVSSSTNSTSIEGFASFQTNVTITNNGNGSNISSKQIRKVKVGTDKNNDQIEYHLFANDKSEQFIYGTFDMTTISAEKGIDYTGDVILKGKNHTLNTSKLILENDTMFLTSKAGTYNIENTFLNQTNCETVYTGGLDLSASFIDKGIAYVGPAIFTGKAHRINSSNTSFVCDYFSMNAPSGSITATPTDVTMLVKKGLVEIDQAKIQITQGTFDLNSRAFGLGIQYVGNLDLSGNMVVQGNLRYSSLLTNASIRELNLSVYRGTQWIENTSVILRNVSLNLSGRTYLEGIYDMNTSAQGAGIVYKGNLNLTGNNTISSNLTNISVTSLNVSASEMNLSVYRGFVRLENMSLTLRNTSLNVSGRTYLEGIYDMNTSSQGAGIVYKGNVNLSGNNTIASSLTNASITELNLSVYRGFVRLENMSLTLRNTSLNVSGRTYLEGIYDMNTSAQGEGIVYKGNLNLTGNNTIASSLTNASITDLNLSALRGNVAIVNTSFDLTGRLFMTGTTKLDGNISFVSDKAIDIRPSIQITNRGNYTQPSILIENTIPSDDMFLRMKYATNHVAIGQYGLQLQNKLRVGYDIILNSLPPNGFTNYQLEVNGPGHFTGNMEFDQNVKILKKLNCSEINTFGSSIFLTSGNISTTGNILVNRIDATGNMSCKAIETQNNSVTMGTGILTLSGNLNCSKIDTYRSSIKGGSIDALNISCLAIETQNQSIYMGTGTLFVKNISCNNLSVSLIELVGNSTTIGETQMTGPLTVTGNTRMNGSLVVTGNTSLNTLNTDHLTVGKNFSVNEFGRMTAPNFILNEGTIDCQKIVASNGKSILGNTTQQVAFDLGTMTATGSVNVSGDLNLTGILRNASNIFSVGSINAIGGMFTNSLRTPIITVDNLNIRPSNTNNNQAYNFNDRGEINASSVRCDYDSTFLKQVTALNFKTSLANSQDVASTKFSVTNGGLLTCERITANSDGVHEFGGSKKIILDGGTIETTSALANKFGLEANRVTLMNGTINATGKIVSTSQFVNTFGISEESGWVALESGKITATSSDAHTFGKTVVGRVRLLDGNITCTSSGPHFFGANINDFTGLSDNLNFVKIDNGQVTCKNSVISPRFEVSDTVYLTASELSCVKINATATVSTTSHNIGTVAISGDGNIINVKSINTGTSTGSCTLSNVTLQNGAITTGTSTGSCTLSNITLKDGAITTGTISTGTNTGSCTISNITLKDGTISAATFNATSDKRVKTKIEDLDAKHSLCLLRALRPKRYDFTNHQGKGRIGFIAQDIQRIGLPVHKSKGIIGNIQQDVICKEGWFRTEFPLHLGDIVKLGENTHEIVEYKEGMFRVQEPFTGIYPLYGIQVDDFLSIEPNAIFTVAVSALQAMDEQIKTQQEQIRFLIQIVGTVIFFSLGASIYVLLK